MLIASAPWVWAGPNPRGLGPPLIDQIGSTWNHWPQPQDKPFNDCLPATNQPRKSQPPRHPSNTKIFHQKSGFLGPRQIYKLQFFKIHLFGGTFCETNSQFTKDDWHRFWITSHTRKLVSTNTVQYSRTYKHRLLWTPDEKWKSSRNDRAPSCPETNPRQEGSHQKLSLMLSPIKLHL